MNERERRREGESIPVGDESAIQMNLQHKQGLVWHLSVEA